MAAPAPPNTPYPSLVFMHRDILVKIAALIGNRCIMCNEGTAVAIRCGHLWDWACLPCFEVLVSSTVGYDDYAAESSCFSTAARYAATLPP